MTEAIFSDGEKLLLADVLDGIIPPSGDGKLPGAGALGLASFIEDVIREHPDTKPAIVRGLSSIDDFARRRTDRPLRALSPEQRQEVLTAHGESDPGFVPTLMFHAYIGYYQHPRVIEGLDLPPRPPHPEGYEIAPTDLSLLEPVRKRGLAYREC
jgi:hypothetical protein